MNFTRFRHKNLNSLFVLVLMVICINFGHIWAALHHHYYVYNQDGYMHMVIASNFLKNHEWYQHLNPQINAPFGSNTHSWTQVITLLIISGTLVLQLIMPLAKALYLWCFLVPMLFNMIATYAMLWTINLFKPTGYQQLFIGAAFLLNPFLSDLFTPLNVDYDFLLITLSIVYWGCLLRLSTTKKTIWAVFVAIIAGLGMWTSISFIIIVFIGLCFIAGLSHKLLKIVLAVLCIVLTIAIRIEQFCFFTIAYDIISIVYLTFFLLLFLGTCLYSACSRRIKAPFILIPALLVILFLIMNYLFPSFYYGPYNHVSSYLLSNFFPNLSEFYSPFTLDRSLGLAIVCYFIIGAGFLYYLFLDNQPLELPILLLLWAASVTLFFAVLMYRWNEFAVPPLILLVSFFVAHWCTTTNNRVARLLIIIIMALLPALIVSQEQEFMSHKAAVCLQQFHTMIEDNYLESPQFNQDKTLFIHSNYGPLILYYTHYSIIATNDHQNPEGVTDSFNFFKQNEERAKQMVMRRAIDLIVLCQAEHPTRFNPDKSKWLQPITLPEKYNLWTMYKVMF